MSPAKKKNSKKKKKTGQEEDDDAQGQGPARRAGHGPDHRRRGLAALDDRQKVGAPRPQLPGAQPVANVSYDKKKGYFEIGKNVVERNLNYNTVKTFAQTLRFMSLSKELIERNDFATKRDAYYQSKNWGDAKFNEQKESDTCMDDVEALFSVHDVSREELRFYPEDHGGSVAGELIVIDQDPETGEDIEIDCTRFGSGAYSIPSSVEHLGFETKAKFVLAIETGGVFQRLNYHKYWRDAKCILIELAWRARAARRAASSGAWPTTAKLPVYAFTDCDPYAFANIYRTLKVGSGNAAHISRFFCVPQAQFPRA